MVRKKREARGERRENFFPRFFHLASRLSLLTSLLLAFPAHAESVLRDTETENFLADQTAPIFHAAGIAPASVHFVLIDENVINAFVAGGQNIFIYSGLILRTENLEELLGVIAHETGHIAGGHLIKMGDYIENASKESILLTLMTLAAAAVSGNASVGEAGTMLTQQTLLSKVLAHSRANEDSADEAGVRFLHKAGLPAIGLQTFMAKLLDEELLPESRQDEYVRTHPLTRDRFESLKGRVEGEKEPPLPQSAEDEYQRIKAKLRGYILPRLVIQEPMGTDIANRYSHAVAYYRMGDMPSALKILDGLQAAEPTNPYFNELRGQLLFEHGKLPEAAAEYQKAAAALPDAPLILQSYGQVLLANNQITQAIPVLLRAQQNEGDSPQTHRLLATAYGRSGHEDMAQLELAEESMLNLDYKSAQRHAKIAKLPPGTPGAQRAQDIIELSKEKIKEEKDHPRDRDN